MFYQNLRSSCADPEGVGGQGVRTPPEKKSQNIGFLTNTGPDPLEKSQSYQKKKRCQSWTPLAKFFGSAHVSCAFMSITTLTIVGSGIAFKLGLVRACSACINIASCLFSHHRH